MRRQPQGGLLLLSFGEGPLFQKNHSEIALRALSAVGLVAVTLYALMWWGTFVFFVTVLTGGILYEVLKATHLDLSLRWNVVGWLTLAQFSSFCPEMRSFGVGALAMATGDMVARLLVKRRDGRTFCFATASTVYIFCSLHALGRLYTWDVPSPAVLHEGTLRPLALWTTVAFVGLVGACALATKKTRIWITVLPLLLCVGCAIYALRAIGQLFAMNENWNLIGADILYTDGRFRILGLFLIVWLTDTGAFLVGRTLGGRKLAPRLSPGKTWSGFWGGVAVASIVCTTAAVLSPHPPFPATTESTPWYGVLALTAVLSMAAHVGDLIESAAKRYLGIKDMGSTIPGHGGLADRFDSLLLVSLVDCAISWGIRTFS